MGFAFSVCARYDAQCVSERLGKRHKTLAMWAHQMISLVRRWLPDRPIKLMGDTAYSVLELGLHANAQQVTLIMTGRMDAVLHEPPPERTQHTHAAPQGSRPTSSFPGTRLTGPRNRLAGAHPGLVWRRKATPGNLYRHSPVVSLWI
jgi:hypothetical protein